jgi:hypothetical protein
MGLVHGASALDAAAGLGGMAGMERKHKSRLRGEL